jgi:hypothetical protein
LYFLILIAVLCCDVYCPQAAKFKRCHALCYGVSSDFLKKFKLIKQNGSVYAIRCFISALNEITTEARIYIEMEEQIDDMLLKNYCRHHRVNLTSIELFSKDNYQIESHAALKSILSTVDSQKFFKLIHHGQPLDEASREILALHQQKTNYLPYSVIQRCIVGDEADTTSKPPTVNDNNITFNDELSHKRQLDRSDTLFYLDIAERKQKLEILTLDAQSKATDTQIKMIEVQKMLMESYTLLCPNQVIDDRARLQFKDNFMNIATQNISSKSSKTCIGEGSEDSIETIGEVLVNKPITINTVAMEMGHRLDTGQLQKIGKRLAAAYRATYKKNPSKHEQLVGQASIHVNSYTERDRVLMKKVIDNFINE